MLMARPYSDDLGQKLLEAYDQGKGCLDESGVTISMTRLYGRRRDGRRIHEAAPQGNWKILTILGAISTRGTRSVISGSNFT
jgi:hypothetical protein